jgi:YHS domain-containing protein
MRTPLLRYVVVGLLISVAPACDRHDACTDCEPGKSTAAAPSVAAASTMKKLAPWETFSDDFVGCAGGCGTRMTGPTEGVVAQPSVIVGQHTYCPVSGVAFEVKATSAHRTIGGTTLYFCCESCAAYFTANQGSILAARGIAT